MLQLEIMVVHLTSVGVRSSRFGCTAAKYAVALITFLSICSCCYAETNQMQQEWPKDVSDSIWMPRSAKDLRLTVADAVYQAYYRADICYPAKNLIEQTRSFMKSKGWSRSEYDLFNPRLKLPYLLGGGIAWAGYPWDEYWKDRAGNVVWYQYSYDVNVDVHDVNAASQTAYWNAVYKSCNLIGIVRYYPSAVFLKVIKRFPGGYYKADQKSND
jgi:hypothetical protein